YIDFGAPSTSYAQQVYVSDGGWGGPEIVYESGPSWITYDPSGFLRLDASGDQPTELPLGPSKVVLRAGPSDVTADMEVSVYPVPELEFKPVIVSRGFTSGAPAKLGLSVWSPIYIEVIKFTPDWIGVKPESLTRPLYGNAEVLAEIHIPAGQSGDIE